MRRKRIVGAGNTYDMGRHVVELRQDPQGWSALVDGLGGNQRYGSEVDAWKAGLVAAELLDRFGAAQPLAVSPPAG